METPKTSEEIDNFLQENDLLSTAISENLALKRTNDAAHHLIHLHSNLMHLCDAVDSQHFFIVSPPEPDPEVTSAQSYWKIRHCSAQEMLRLCQDQKEKAKMKLMRDSLQSACLGQDNLSDYTSVFSVKATPHPDPAAPVLQPPASTPTDLTDPVDLTPAKHHLADDDEDEEEEVVEVVEDVIPDAPPAPDDLVVSEPRLPRGAFAPSVTAPGQAVDPHASGPRGATSVALPKEAQDAHPEAPPHADGAPPTGGVLPGSEAPAVTLRPATAGAPAATLQPPPTCAGLTFTHLKIASAHTQALTTHTSTASKAATPKSTTASLLSLPPLPPLPAAATRPFVPLPLPPLPPMPGKALPGLPGGKGPLSARLALPNLLDMNANFRLDIPPPPMTSTGAPHPQAVNSAASSGTGTAQTASSSSSSTASTTSGTDTSRAHPASSDLPVPTAAPLNPPAPRTTQARSPLSGPTRAILTSLLTSSLARGPAPPPAAHPPSGTPAPSVPAPVLAALPAPYPYIMPFPFPFPTRPPQAFPVSLLPNYRSTQNAAKAKTTKRTGPRSKGRRKRAAARKKGRARKEAGPKGKEREREREAHSDAPHTENESDTGQGGAQGMDQDDGGVGEGEDEGDQTEGSKAVHDSVPQNDPPFSDTTSNSTPAAQEAAPTSPHTFASTASTSCSRSQAAPTTQQSSSRAPAATSDEAAEPTGLRRSQRTRVPRAVWRGDSSDEEIRPTRRKRMRFTRIKGKRKCAKRATVAVETTAPGGNVQDGEVPVPAVLVPATASLPIPDMLVGGESATNTAGTTTTTHTSTASMAGYPPPAGYPPFFFPPHPMSFPDDHPLRRLPCYPPHAGVHVDASADASADANADADAPLDVSEAPHRRRRDASGE